MLPALVIFVGAPLVIWWLRRSRDATPGSLRVVTRTALTRNGVVAVLETDGRRFLVGATDHGVSLLSELEAHGKPDDPPTGVDTDDSAAGPIDIGPGPRTSPIDALRNMTVRRSVRHADRFAPQIDPNQSHRARS